VHYVIRLDSGYRGGAAIFASVSPTREEDGPSSHGAVAFHEIRSDGAREAASLSYFTIEAAAGCHPLSLASRSPPSPKPPCLRRHERCVADRRPLRSPTNCARAPRASWLRPPPLASLSSCLPERRSSLRAAVGPSPNQTDLGCSERLRPGAYAKHLITFLGDAFLGVTLSRPSGGGHKPKICSHAAALLEAVGISHGEHEGERRERSDPLDLAQELGFWVVLFGDRLKLSVVFADALGQRADLLQDGT
jgi:hypothetical protein